ncbi:hypothetical protein [Streptomyces corynorhini]|uniref:hypothetical protein n=1 Tax=Streptomyces corynorhini TaxID=2282652 RepID=UPI001314854D|nr:hypothetical protein [Streptomyces corynorhini]
MRALTAPDATQSEILAQLAVTEALLSRVATKVSGRQRDAEIVPMPDLGLPHNVRRIHGGFFTGAYYGWESDVPMVPVDATVNLCGVSVFRTSADFPDAAEFSRRVAAAKAKLAAESRYVWNFARGNHFIILAEVRGDGGLLPPGRYLVLHASAAEFKDQYNGLYPTPGNWYADAVRHEEGADGRYLRYLHGAPAERFHRLVRMLEDYQCERQWFCASLVAGRESSLEEVLSVPHYGMPDSQSVAIGCQWLDPARPTAPLLTRPGAPLYLVRARPGGANEVTTGRGRRLLTPHGLGVRSDAALDLGFHPGALGIAGRRYRLEESLAGAGFTAIRAFDRDTDLTRVLADCPGTVVAELHQKYSYYRSGDHQ